MLVNVQDVPAIPHLVLKVTKYVVGQYELEFKPYLKPGIDCTQMVRPRSSTGCGSTTARSRPRVTVRPGSPR